MTSHKSLQYQILKSRNLGIYTHAVSRRCVCDVRNMGRHNVSDDMVMSHNIMVNFLSRIIKHELPFSCS